MANVKNSCTSNAGTSHKGRGRIDRSKSLGVSNKKNAPTQVKKHARSNMPIGSKVNDNFIDNVLLNNVQLRKDIQSKKQKIVSNGRIISKHNLKLFNKILKSELQIDDKKTKKNSINNDNYATITNIDQSQNIFSNITFSDETILDSELINDDVKIRENKDKDKKVKRVKKRRVSRKDLLFECDLCRKQFNSKCSLRRHMYLHLNVKTYSCKKCKKVFRKQLYLSAHIKRQHPNWNKHYMCNICDKPFLLKDNLKLHLASHTRTETMFKCIYCKEEYSDQQKLIKHEKQHLISGRYQCIICEMDFDCRNRLTRHFKSHLRVKDYICQYCGKEFLRMNSMRRHVQICHAGIRIQCPICNKYLKGHLTEHMRTHEKKRPHECPDCGQRFTQSTQLTVHRRSHTGARPYPCRICGRPFSHSNALMLHIRRHTGEKPFPCAMCPLSFSQLPHMKAHMRNIHGKENPYKCKKCQQFFKLKIELERHAKGCGAGDKEKKQSTVSTEDVEVESVMSLSRMRFLLALLLTMIATKEKLKYLGFNKRLIDDLLVESLEAMGHKPCKDDTLTPLKRLRINIDTLLNGTVPKEQMEKFKKENKSTEQLLELLTDAKKAN